MNASQPPARGRRQGGKLGKDEPVALTGHSFRALPSPPARGWNAGTLRSGVGRHMGIGGPDANSEEVPARLAARISDKRAQ